MYVWMQRRAAAPDHVDHWIPTTSDSTPQPVSLDSVDDTTLNNNKQVDEPIENSPHLRDIGIEPSVIIDIPKDIINIMAKPSVMMKESAVPASRIQRLVHYGGLAAGVGLGMVSEAARRAVGASSSDSSTSLLLSDRNIERIVDRLSTMRGAALKLGQMLSIQDSSLLPPELDQILLRVQNSANYMPDSQLQRVMSTELGDDWLSKFKSFDLIPFSAASIGQVHRAELHDGTRVAVKVQYPGVAASIDSDLSYLKSLASMSSLLPKGMYLDSTIKVARRELGWECDYHREAESTERFKGLVDAVYNSRFSARRDGPRINVPRVVKEFSTGKVLVTEFVDGVSVGTIGSLPQSIRDQIGDALLDLCLKELFEFRFMQTDPNWSNFLYDPHTHTIHLIDFGGAREYDKKFTDNYFRVLYAASTNNRDECVRWSQELGFLTGMESETMVSAHVKSLLALAEPFILRGKTRFDFGAQDITTRVRSELPTLLRERLTPPPEETYSLHRKLSGFFLLCTKLGARVQCGIIFKRAWDGYRF